MLIPSILAAIHHLLVFGLVAFMAIQLTLVRPQMAARDIPRVARIDIVFGMFAVALIVVGVLRVFFGDKGASFYYESWTFWLKMTAFAMAFLFSIRPTMRFAQWRRNAGTDQNFRPSSDEVAEVRGWMRIEAIALAVIPVIAAFMARGY